MRSLILAAVVLAAVALPATASPSQLVVVNRSMAGVKLGMSPASVKKQLGKAESQSTCGSSEMDKATCGGAGVTNWRYMKGQLSVTFIKNRVVRLSTTSPKLRTRSGVGVGVAFSKVLQRYPNGTPGGRPNFKWYYLGAAPTKTGDVYTFASDASGTMKGRVRDFDIGRFDSAHHCAFFSDVPQCA
jgi:hypothetical protein